ncbi:MAG TPA: hypothetical protein VJU86_05300 [Pyrinomonadaceae bacterium]|nr:hypothetical protein [Pyrinomonadaceae bacterium]
MKLSIISLMLCTAFCLSASAQTGGGTVTSGAATTTSTKSTKPAATTATTPKAKARSSKPSAPRATGTANIDGKWWTTGNDFGSGEVVFTQSGSNVTGVIRFSDGRTGSVTGKIVGMRLQHSFTDSSGRAGSGWLEQSWNNFLGGPWRNQATKDGSWTLSRIEGNWCFGGSRNRIRRVTHDATGKISMVTEDGSQEEGHLDGPWLYLHSDMGNIKGDQEFRSNRVNWSTGFYWTWCGR